MGYYVFFLGGQDLEMLTIRKLLENSGQKFYDKQLKWGAKASAYSQEIERAPEFGGVPVLVELEVGIKLPESTLVVDHHNDRSGEEASILQVVRMLGYAPTKNQNLVAANDSGYIPAMLREGASREEIADIRRRDREAQGVTEEMERQAEEALSNYREARGVIIVHIPHNKFSTVTDRLYEQWNDGRENLVVVCDTAGDECEVYHFGRGDICHDIKTKWNGFGGGQGFGDRTKNAFAGCKTKTPVDIVNFVVTQQVM